MMIGELRSKLLFVHGTLSPLAFWHTSRPQRHSRASQLPRHLHRLHLSNTT